METSYRGLDYESGKIIQGLRNAIGLTQAGLAEYLGVSVRTVKEWEAGGSYPKTERLKALIVLAIQYQAFPKGSEAEEIRALWRTTHQKRLLNEDWLSALFAEPPASQEQSEDPLRQDATPPHGATQVPANASQDRQLSESGLDKPVRTAVGQGVGSAVRRPRFGPGLATTLQGRVLVGQAQNRPRMLRQLGSTYRELMDQSLQGAAWLELGLAYKADAVQNAANLLWRVKRGPEQHLPAGTSIAEVYDEAGYELLILGEPGSGKSTLLLELAHQLVLRAEQDETHPLPVILPLSTWAAKRLKLEDWIAEQMCEIYDVPRTLSTQWIREDAILPLLDGLDEMEESLRPACITAINAYRSFCRPPLIVCSRKTEYETAAERKRLKLQSAVVVQPLTQAQVESCLVQMGQPTTLCTILKEHPELVTTPLMLNVLFLTYRETGVDHLPDIQALLQEQIWTDYVARMVERKGNASRYPHARTVSYLRWLAQQMQRRKQTIFYLEHLQPDWLDAKRQRAYSWWAVRLPGILIGVLVSLLLTGFFSNIQSPALFFQYGVLGGLLATRSRGSVQEKGIWLAKDQNKMWKKWGERVAVSLFIGLLFACSFGLDGQSKPENNSLIYGIVFGLSSFLFQSLPPRASLAHISATANRPIRGWKALVHFFQTAQGQYGLIGFTMGGLAYGLSTGLSYGLILGTVSGLNLAISFGLSSVLVSFILEGQMVKISLIERLRWTRRSLSNGLSLPNHLNVLFPLIAGIWLFVGLSYGLYYGIPWGLDFGLSAGLSNGLSLGISYGLICGICAGLIYWFLSGLFQGTVQEWMEDRDRRVPNQGIRLSLQNSLIMGLIGAGVIGIISVLFFVLSNVLTDILRYGRAYGPHYELGYLLNYGVSYGLSNALSFGPLISICGGLLVCIGMGGLAVWRHCVIRFLLWRSQAFPGRAPQFLNDASTRFLLRRVGGGYSFIHCLLLDYLVGARESDR